MDDSRNARTAQNTGFRELSRVLLFYEAAALTAELRRQIICISKNNSIPPALTSKPSKQSELCFDH